MLDSFSALSALEIEASDREREEAKVKSRSQKLRRQQETIEQLSKKRDQLQNRLQNMSTSAAGTGSDDDDDGGVTETQRKLCNALNYRAMLKEKLNVYLLSGVSVVKTTANSKVLRFTTSYRCIYHETYHLTLQRLGSGHFRVVHHDFPSFIMGWALPGNREVKDMMALVRPLREALAMYVRRREEFKRAQMKLAR